MLSLALYTVFVVIMVVLTASSSVYLLCQQLLANLHIQILTARAENCSNLTLSIQSDQDNICVWVLLQHLQLLSEARHSMLLQAGGLAALPVTSLRSQPDFLKCVAVCISASPPHIMQNAGGPDTLAGSWANRASEAWQLLAEAHAVTIITTEAFLHPQEAGESASILLVPM